MSVSKALSPFAATPWQHELTRVLKRLHVPFPHAWDPTPYPGHSTAVELIEHLGRDYFDSLFSFAFVRNPWDWQVSMYTYAASRSNHRRHEIVKRFDDFGEYLRWRRERRIRCQRDFVLSLEGEQLVDFVGRFERLEQDFAEICSRIGISASLPKVNVSRARPYQEYYCEETKAMVGEMFAADIEAFGYRFD